MNKEQLERYWEELHYALDREMVDDSPATRKSLRKACKAMEKHLARCPGGDELISVAKQSVQFARC
jgi:hypothetical protein